MHPAFESRLFREFLRPEFLTRPGGLAIFWIGRILGERGEMIDGGGDLFLGMDPDDPGVGGIGLDFVLDALGIQEVAELAGVRFALNMTDHAHEEQKMPAIATAAQMFFAGGAVSLSKRAGGRVCFLTGRVCLIVWRDH